MGMQIQHYLRPLAFLLICLLFVTFFVKEVIIDNPVFGPATQKYAEISWDDYLKNRQRRNIKKMNLSYEDLMIAGDSLVSLKEWEQAMDFYYNAKTVFPERIGARRNMCYALLMKCQDNRSYCSYAKREIYYASQYTDDNDPESKKYIESLVDLTGLSHIVTLDESEALSSIF